MDKHYKYHQGHSGGGFSNGFLLGALLGGGVVFLLGTKKGKEVLKMLMENGFESVSEMKDLLKENDGDEYMSTDTPDMEEGEVITSDKKTESLHEEPQKITKSIKRFFRGIKR